MKPYTKICSDEGKTKNTGYKKVDCLETLLAMIVLSNGHTFATVEEFEDKSAWKAGQVAKTLVPLFDAYEVADASTEDTYFETGNFKRRTEKGKEILTFESYLSPCAYAALKSYENSGYTEAFEFNQGGDYSGVFDTDGVKVRGRKITSITADRKRATKEKVPYVAVEIVFEDKDDVLGVVLTKSDLSKDDLDGIYDVNLNVVSSTATTIKVTATSGCAGGDKVLSLASGDLIVRDGNGQSQTVSFTSADANGEYTLTGSGFATGFTVEVNGVIAQTDIIYEGDEAVEITV